jgi:hypothetical protein
LKRKLHIPELKRLDVTLKSMIRLTRKYFLDKLKTYPSFKKIFSRS